MSSVTYAKETLLATDTTPAADASDKTGYHDIVLGHIVSAPAGVAASPGDVYLVTYVLDGLVFAAAPAMGSPPDFTIAAGGAVGDDRVVFRSGPGSTVAASEPIAMTARFAISGEGSGSITRTVMNRSLEGIVGIEAGKTLTASGIIKAVPALKETVTPRTPGPTAMAAHRFMAFYPSSPANRKLSTTLGTIELDVEGGAVADSTITTANVHGAEQYRDAGATTPFLSLNDDNAHTFVVNALSDILAGAPTSATNAGVTFAGDFSFVEKLGLAGSAAVKTDGSCTAGAELRKPSTSDPTDLTNEVTPQPGSAFAKTGATTDDTMALCLTVDGETAMPVRAPYTVTTEYKGIANAAFPPQGGTHDLATIRRDGTTFRVPFVTTSPRFEQRFSIVNRGAATTYAVGELHAQSGVTAAAGDKATGALPRGQMVLMASDLVTITGGTRAAATLSVVSDPSNIDASIDIMHPETGTVATVHMTAAWRWAETPRLRGRHLSPCLRKHPRPAPRGPCAAFPGDGNTDAGIDIIHPETGPAGPVHLTAEVTTGRDPPASGPALQPLPPRAPPTRSPRTVRSPFSRREISK